MDRRAGKRAHITGAARAHAGRRIGPRFDRGPLRELRAPLDLADVGGLEPLGPLGDLELDLVPLDQALETLSLDGAEMHEHVLAILLGDEAVPLRIVEPLHVTLSHLSATSSLEACASVIPHHYGGAVRPTCSTNQNRPGA